MRSVGVKLKRLTILIAIITVAIAGQARGTSERESFGQKVKRFFTGPPPTPTPSPKKSKPSRKKKPTPKPLKSVSPTVSPPSVSTESPSPSPTTSPSPTLAASPDASPSESPTESSPATEAPEVSQTPQSAPTVNRERRAELIEPVRPITPGPRTKRRASASPTPEETSRDRLSQKKKSRTATTTIAADEILDYDSYPPNVRKILDLSLSLTNQNLGYKYGSADPANGGMDGSGFIHYVLAQSGIKDPPRDAREQYVWVRKAGNFQAVLGHTDDTFELDALKPGDLLFWSGTNPIAREPDITETMIYLGREKGTNRRIMIGASDGRTYNGHPQFGVSVFDFKVARSPSKSEDKAKPNFVGYGPIPNLPAE